MDHVIRIGLRLMLCACLGASMFATAEERTGDMPSTAVESERQKALWREIIEGKPHEAAPAPQQGRTPVIRQIPQPQPPSATDADKSVVEAYQAALREYYIYLQKGTEHRQRVFAWQHYSSIVIFAVVIALVVAGVYFAAVQFHYGLRNGISGGVGTTELEANKDGLKISSPVLGVIILLLSLAFFYLYLVFVYPIQEIY